LALAPQVEPASFISKLFPFAYFRVLTAHYFQQWWTRY